MDLRLLISKVIILLYRTRELGVDTYDQLVKNSLGLIKEERNKEFFLGTGKMKSMVEHINTMMQNKEKYNLDVLLDHLAVIMDKDPSLFKIIKTSISRELDEDEIKSVIVALSGELAFARREQEAIDLISTLYTGVKFNRASIGNTMNYIKETWEKIEPLTARGENDKDPAIVNEVSFDNEGEVVEAFEALKEHMSDAGIYRTGWQELNKMTQGGLRSGETVTTAALQHNYKTGFTMSLFMQLLRHNTPVVSTEGQQLGKKPLAIRISLEDSLENNLQFMFQYLKANDGQALRPKELKEYNLKEMARYTRDKIQATGFSVKMVRVDPSDWGADDLMRMIIQLETEGYEIKIVVLDYLTKMQTTGFNNQGGHGVDKRALLSKMRNFMSARDILFITPLQLSTEAKALRRNGTPDVRLVKEIADKGYYADSKQLDQEIDLELYLNKVYHQGKWYLSVGRGKHRIPTILESEEDKFFLLPFKNSHTPILEDINGDNTGLKSLPRTGGGGFDGASDLLDEIGL